MLNEDDINKKKIYNNGPMEPEFLPYNNPVFSGDIIMPTPTYSSTIIPDFDINGSWTDKVVDITLNHPDAKVPTKQDGDGAYDLISVEDAVVLPGQRCKVNTGISIRLPKNWVGLIWPRSGLAVKNGLHVMAGVIDGTYGGDVIVCFYNTGFDSVHLPKGSKIAQYIIQEYKTVTFRVVDKLPESIRGEKGFGSSGL